jgi:hypothetical protein
MNVQALPAVARIAGVTVRALHQYEAIGLPVPSGRSQSDYRIDSEMDLLRLQEGRVEDDRPPDLRRCERIRWVRWAIENAPTHAEIDEWQNTRSTEVNTLLWYREEYLVVLAQRRDYWLLKTAYCTTQGGRIAKKRRERDAFLAKNKKEGQE